MHRSSDSIAPGGGGRAGLSGRAQARATGPLAFPELENQYRNYLNYPNSPASPTDSESPARGGSGNCANPSGRECTRGERDSLCRSARQNCREELPTPLVLLPIWVWAMADRPLIRGTGRVDLGDRTMNRRAFCRRQHAGRRALPRFLIVKDGKMIANEFGGAQWPKILADLKKQIG